MTQENKCDCGTGDWPFSYEIVPASEHCDCRKFGVVSIDDVPVGTGRLDEQGKIVDVEWDEKALSKVGLRLADVRRS